MHNAQADQAKENYLKLVSYISSPLAEEGYRARGGTWRRSQGNGISGVVKMFHRGGGGAVRNFSISWGIAVGKFAVAAGIKSGLLEIPDGVIFDRIAEFLDPPRKELWCTIRGADVSFTPPIYHGVEDFGVAIPAVLHRASIFMGNFCTVDSIIAYVASSSRARHLSDITLHSVDVPRCIEAACTL
jgi:hypothetical protein